jgi:hypothetical protein
MKFDKRDAYFVGVWVVLVAFLSLFQFTLTGNVIWEPVTEVVNCSNTQVGLLWDEIFVESSTGITIIKASGASCEGFVAYKVKNGNEIYLLEGLNTNYPTGYLTVNSWEVNHSYAVSASYFASTPEFIADFVTKIAYGGAHWSSIKVENVTNHTLAIVEESYVFHNSLFKPDVSDNLVENTSNYGISVLQTGSYPIYGYFQTEESSSLEFFSERIFKNIKFAGFYFTRYDGSKQINVSLKANVSNFTFEANSSWNYAFDFKDIFNYGAGVSVGFEYTGVNNTAGQYINWTINGTKVYFKPNASFVGYKNFQVSAMSAQGTIYSNTFNVTIVETLNDRPTLKQEFEQLFVPKGGNETLDLEEYFDDPNGDTLTYNTTNVTNITVTFSGNDMIVKLKENFTDHETFYVYASDGEMSVSSNKVYVFEEVTTSTQLNVTNDTEAAVFLGASDGGVASFGSNASGNETGDGGEGDLTWVFWALGGFAFLGLIALLIYFLILSKPAEPAFEGPSPVVQNYLEEVTKGKPVGPPATSSPVLPPAPKPIVPVQPTPAPVPVVVPTPVQRAPVPAPQMPRPVQNPTGYPGNFTRPPQKYSRP